MSVYRVCVVFMFEYVTVTDIYVRLRVLKLTVMSAVIYRGKGMCPRKETRIGRVSAVFKRGYKKKQSFVPAVGSSIQRLGSHLLNNCSLTTTCQGTGPIFH